MCVYIYQSIDSRLYVYVCQDVRWSLDQILSEMHWLGQHQIIMNRI